MTARYREDQHYIPRTGSYWFSGTLIGTYSAPQYEAWTKCWDTVGQIETDNPFDLYRYTSRVPGLFGSRVSSGVTYREVDGVPIDYKNRPADPRGYYPVLTSNELENLAWETVGKTNPSKPAISVPTAIGELKDLPDLLRAIPSHFPEKLRAMPIHAAMASLASYANIWCRFGLLPFVRDLRKISQFVKEVEKLLRALRKLQKDGYLTRRAFLRTGGFSDLKVYTGYLNTGCNFYVKGDRYLACTEKVWGSCRWVLAGDLDLPKGDAELDKRLRAITGGFNVQESMATIWELIPWSWLIDWFIGIQDFLNALQNQLPLEVDGICIMRTLTLKSKYVLDMSAQTVYNVDPIVLGQYYERGVRKERYPMSLAGVPTVSIPVLSPGQWSILGSLAVLKVPKHAW